MVKLLILFLFFSQLFTDEKAEYDVMIWNKKIGKTFVEKNKLSDGSIEYIFKTNANAKVFFRERTSQADVSIIFKDNELKSGSCKIERDGDWQYVEMKKVNGVYEIDNNGEKLIERNSIPFSVTMLFFEEPVGIDKIWVERLSEYTTVEKVDEHKYKMKVDGKYNFYTYENGKLVEFMNKNIVNVYMNLME